MVKIYVFLNFGLSLRFHICNRKLGSQMWDLKDLVAKTIEMGIEELMGIVESGVLGS